MKKNRIYVFNRLTSTDELKDVSEFEDLVGKHYQKFKYLYAIISNDEVIKYIDDIRCKLHDSRIDFKIELNEPFDDYMESILQDAIKEVDMEDDDSFDITYNGEKDELVITISEY